MCTISDTISKIPGRGTLSNFNKCVKFHIQFKKYPEKEFCPISDTI
jgi:hypothetical protein